MRRLLAFGIAVLAACGKPSPAAEREARERDAFIHRLAEKEGLSEAWSLVARTDVRFEDGFSIVMFENPEDRVFEWYQVCSGCSAGTGRPVRWMNRRAHFRLRRDREMRLVLIGRVSTQIVMTRPRVEVTIDGVELGAGVVAPSGAFRYEAVVPRGADATWSDAYVSFSSVSEPWREPGDLKAAVLESLRWEPPDPPAAP